MKISYNPNIFCLFSLITHLKYLQWRVGGNQFLEIYPYTGGGQHIQAGLPYPPP